MENTINKTAFQGLGLCCRCLYSFSRAEKIDVSKNEAWFAEKLASQFNITVEKVREECDIDVCLSCFDSLRDQSLLSVIDESRKFVVASNGKFDSNSVNFQVTIPPLLDLTRFSIRAILMRDENDRIKMPTLESTLSSILATMYNNNPSDSTHDENSTMTSSVPITVDFEVSSQRNICRDLFPSMSFKKPKRKHHGTNSSSSETEYMSSQEDFETLSRVSVDSVLCSLKTINETELTKLTVRLKSLLQETRESNALRSAKFKIKYTKSQFYILGRYVKRARDVPQSAWTPGNGARIGHNSVEEIVCHQIKESLQTQDCQMHACGREDIDVRMLGNGRPFALQLRLPCLQFPNAQALECIREKINNGEGLNHRLDLHISLLASADEGIWRAMQEEAERKNKGYRCIIYCSRAVTKEELQLRIDNCTDSCNDDKTGCMHSDLTQQEQLHTDGLYLVPCGLQISQKTPLRVLHRRSLLSRPREVHGLKTTFLTPHFFILDLVTTAGTYVKEFVHGDLGRTVPNVGSLLKCKAHILQLDVIRLYDHFPGHDIDLSSSAIAKKRET